MKNLLIPLIVYLTAIMTSCGSSNLSPAEMAEIGFEKYSEDNYVEAVEWYQKAADLGNGRAQNNLAVLYQYGAGVEKDLAKAHIGLPKPPNKITNIPI